VKSAITARSTRDHALQLASAAAPAYDRTMKTFEQQLAQYGAYHRDPRNIATHFLGVPMIMFAVVILLSRPVFFAAGGLAVTPALLIGVITGLYYLRLHAATGLLMAMILATMLWGAQRIAGFDSPVWLGWGSGLFVVGWIIQAIGHVYEGRKPAFVDDLMGLIIGPLFVLCEALFALGLLPHARAAIEAEAGPIRRNRVDVPA
jgi:uncharacterized membrane protein YGL010W